MRNLSVTSRLALGVGILTVGVFAPATTLAVVDLHLRLGIGGYCVDGGKPTADPITVRLLRADGTTRDTEVDSAGTTFWQVCFSRIPVTGNKIRMSTNGTTRTARIPNLTVTADRVASVISGRAPAGSTVDIEYLECYPAGCIGPEVRSATANGNGRYRRDVSSSIDIDGSDYLTVRFINGHGDEFRRETLAPYLEIKARNKIFIGCQPKGTTTVKLRKSDGTLRASRSLTAAKDCSGENGSFKKNGDPVHVNTGNRIRADFASDAWLEWPTMAVNGSGSTVSGRCLKNARYMVFIQHNSTFYSTSGTTDSNGEFSDSDSFTLESGDVLDLVCETIRGDRVRLTRVLP